MEEGRRLPTRMIGEYVLWYPCELRPPDLVFHSQVSMEIEYWLRKVDLIIFNFDEICLDDRDLKFENVEDYLVGW